MATVITIGVLLILAALAAWGRLIGEEGEELGVVQLSPSPEASDSRKERRHGDSEAPPAAASMEAATSGGGAA